MLDKLKKNLIISVVIAVLVFFLFGVFSDFNSVINSFAQFDWLLFPLLLILSLGNYFVRFLKWDYYLHILGISVTKKISLKIFFSGLSMSASPGKMGELLKCFFLKEIKNEPISKTAPIIFAERVTDFLSLIFLTLLVGIVYNYSGLIVYLVLLFFVSVVIIVGNRRLAEFFIFLIEKIRFLKPHIEKIKNLYESSYILLKPRPLFWMFLVSIGSWFFECIGFYLILIDFNQNVSILWPTFVYALSTIIGAVSMLPGGLGVTEGSLSLLMINGGMPPESAIASTFILRVVTLWFAVIIGIFVLASFRKGLKNSKEKSLI